MTETRATDIGRGRVAPLSTYDDFQCHAASVLRGESEPIGAMIGAVAILLAALDVETLDAARDALRHAGARDGLTAAILQAQHGGQDQGAREADGWGDLYASFVALTIATARLMVVEDDDAAVIDRDATESWRGFVERAGRVAFVRALRARWRADAAPASSDAMYRAPAPDDPAVTAPRATRKGRSPGSAVNHPRLSRSERASAATRHAADAWADALGQGPDVDGGVPAVIGAGRFGASGRVAHQPRCIWADEDGPAFDPDHECRPTCWLGGWMAYAPRVDAAHRPLPIGTAGPVLAGEPTTEYVWRPTLAAPVGTMVRRIHAEGVLTDAHDVTKNKSKVTWTMPNARQYLQARTTTKRSIRLTPATWSNKARGWHVPTKTAAAIADGATVEADVVTIYGDVRFVGHRRSDESRAVRRDRAASKRRAAVKSKLTTQQAAVTQLVCDAALLTMLDSRPRIAHRDASGNTWSISQPNGTLTLATPDGFLSPLPTDPRRMANAVRALVLSAIPATRTAPITAGKPPTTAGKPALPVAVSV